MGENNFDTFAVMCAPKNGMKYDFHAFINLTILTTNEEDTLTYICTGWLLLYIWCSFSKCAHLKLKPMVAFHSEAAELSKFSASLIVVILHVNKSFHQTTMFQTPEQMECLQEIEGGHIYDIYVIITLRSYCSTWMYVVEYLILYV